MPVPKTNEFAAGRIFEIQRMSTEDGPGIRTTVFFKGCSLKCVWCHNPESISPRPQVQWIANRCIACRTCLEACPEAALVLSPQGMKIDRLICNGCGRCAEACPSTAMEVIGREWALEELLYEVLKDRAYFRQSDGGVTVSGGEPGLQAPFVAAFLGRLREHGVHTALDTCGMVSGEVLDSLLPYANLVLYDIKEIDPDRHAAWTGHSNRTILGNLMHTAEFMGTHLYPRELWIRTPIIPMATDRRENILGIGRFIAEHLRGKVARWDLCAFNNLCRDKYLRLDREWPYRDQGLLETARMIELFETARASGVDPDIVHWSGATRMDARQSAREMISG
ncbi:MAG: glycyl-radical enzyme activating protein [Thermodesulfobacteriota bacterium]